MTDTSTTGTQIADALAAGADGTQTAEAAIMLLADSSCWLDREDFTSQFTATGTGGDGTPTATIDWEAAITALDAGELPCSGGEQRILRLAASIAAGSPVSLSDTLPGIDKRNALVAIQAIAHAAGQTWLADGTLGEHAGLLTTLDNFLRSSPAVMDALAAFMARETGLPSSSYAASLVMAEVSFAALWHQQVAGHDDDNPVERIGVKFP